MSVDSVIQAKLIFDFVNRKLGFAVKLEQAVSFQVKLRNVSKMAGHSGQFPNFSLRRKS